MYSVQITMEIFIHFVKKTISGKRGCAQDENAVDEAIY